MKMIPLHLPFPLYDINYTVYSFVVRYKSSANNYRYNGSYFPVFAPNALRFWAKLWNR